MQFSPSKFRTCVELYEDNWSLNDKTLYSLCKNNYSHDSMNNINAKLWIIGRAYATGIERKIRTNGLQGGALSKLAAHLYRNRRRVNTIFRKLGGITQFTPENLRTIVSLHGQFVQLIRRATQNMQTTRSFVSKYMHFHCPLVPIYDSNTSQTFPKFVGWNKNLKVFKIPRSADEDYYRFVLRFWELYQIASEEVCVEKIKHLDYYLIRVSEEHKKKKGKKKKK